MPSIDLNSVPPATLQDQLATHSTIVACLCAAWCDVCKTYRPKFEALAAEYPQLLFIWVDIEDQAALVDDLDVDNFPTLLIQHDNSVSFYGTMLPDTAQLKRLLQFQLQQSPEQLREQATGGAAQREWQTLANLRARIADRA